MKKPQPPSLADNLNQSRLSDLASFTTSNLSNYGSGSPGGTATIYTGTCGRCGYPYTVYSLPNGTGIVTCNFCGSPLNQLAVTPEDDPVTIEERRKDPEKVLWSDLREGDVVTRTDDGRVATVTKKASDYEYGQFTYPDGSIGNYRRSASQIKRDGWVLGATHTKPKVEFDSVILEETKKNQILDAIKQVDNAKLIFEDWGFNDVFEKGKAVSLLFYGPPGTGKTLMAQAIADKYEYKLEVISTAEIESSEPGGAERAIKAYFEKASKDKKTVLLFDECDSLIHDRSQIGMILGAQVNALLTALESYEGIAIFTTNQLGSLDPAFDRRLSLKLEFSMPDVTHRKLIWQRMFPEACPVGVIDWDALAEVEITGGYIKNVVLRAARKAANQDIEDDKKKITMKHLWEALKHEAAAMTDFQAAVAGSGKVGIIGPNPRRTAAGIEIKREKGTAI